MLLNHRGFTLLEMLIVLAILAALTMTAVQSLGPIEQQARSQTTLRTLESIKAAILSVNPSGGTTVVGGFAADMGTLPNSTSPAAFLNDLAFNNGPMHPAFPVMDGQGGQYGWRGPYLQTALNCTHCVDGWNRSLGVRFLDGSGAITTTLTLPSDRLVVYSDGSPDGSTGMIETSIAFTQLSAWPLTVRMYAVDTSNNRTALSGTGTATLLGGINPTTSTIHATALTCTAAVGTDFVCQFVPTPTSLLVGNRLLTVTFTSSSLSNYSISSPQTFHLNLIPGTSPSIDVLVARQNASTTGS
jgi:prepilin-type N-terminal cleavage/methylation domain-containing protein